MEPLKHNTDLAVVRMTIPAQLPDWRNSRSQGYGLPVTAYAGSESSKDERFVEELRASRSAIALNDNHCEFGLRGKVREVVLIENFLFICCRGPN